MRAFVLLLIAHPRITALLAAFALSFSGILYRLSETSPETGSFFRCLYGLPILLAAAWFERRELGPLPRRSVYLAAVAGVLFAVDLVFWHHAVDAVGAGLATVLGNLSVVIVGIGAWLLFGERPSTRTVLALPLVLAGIVLISGVLTANSYGADPALGVGLGIVAAFAYAFYLLLIRQVGRRRAGEPVAISTTATLAVSLLAGLGLGSLDFTPTWPAHMWLMLLGVSAQSAGYLLISISLPRLPAVVTSIILLAQPVLAVIFSILLVQETPSVGQFLGVTLLLGGIALATLPLGKRQKERTRPDVEARPA
ncbi:MAG: DMT family transporter [Chloroflexota bacterium]